MAALGTTLAATAKPHLISGAVDHPIVVDGQENDWSGSLQPFGDQPFSVQVENDAAFLYLRLSASTPAARRGFMRFGMTVWFDPKGAARRSSASGIR